MWGIHPFPWSPNVSSTVPMVVTWPPYIAGPGGGWAPFMQILRRMSLYDNLLAKGGAHERTSKNRSDQSSSEHKTDLLSDFGLPLSILSVGERTSCTLLTFGQVGWLIPQPKTTGGYVP